MSKTSSVSSKLCVSETNNKHQQLNNFINTFVLSNMLNVFKVIYIKDCKSRDNWYNQVATHVGGLKSTRCLTYQVEVLTYMYSYSTNSYVQEKHVLDNVHGFEIVDSCFKKISNVSNCDALVINIKALNQTILTPSNYSCSYLFART